MHPASGELDTRRFEGGSLRNGRMKRLARGGWGLAVLNEEIKVAAKLYGPLRGLHQDIILAESVLLSCGTCGTSVLDGTGQFTYASTWRTDLGAHRRDRATPLSGEVCEGSRDNAARARRHDFAVVAAGERAGGRAGEESLSSAPVIRTVRTELQRKGYVPGLVGPVPGSLSRLREIQRMGDVVGHTLAKTGGAGLYATK